MTKPAGPLKGQPTTGPLSTKAIRDDWQMAGATGPKTKAKAKAMQKPPFPKRNNSTQ